MKVMVLRLIEYEFDDQSVADENLARMVHSLNVGNMKMRSSIIQRPFGPPVREVTVDLAAEATGRPISTVRRWAALGKITARKVGKAWLVDANSLPPRKMKKVKTTKSEKTGHAL